MEEFPAYKFAASQAQQYEWLKEGLFLKKIVFVLVKIILFVNRSSSIVWSCETSCIGWTMVANRRHLG